MATFQDQIGRALWVDKAPKKIVSTVPSQTEVLYDLGLEENVVGITKFCVHPKHWLKTKTIIGGTKNLNIDKIKALQPDLILSNKEENTPEAIHELAQLFPVYVSDVKNHESAMNMLNDIGKMTGKQKVAQEWIDEINSRYQRLKVPPVHNLRRALYLIWKNPWMSVGADTFIHQMMQLAGFQNVTSHLTRYPELTQEAIEELQPELILLSSEPYPFREKHAKAMQQLWPDTKVKCVDGEMFSWYGTKMKRSYDYLLQIRKA